MICKYNDIWYVYKFNISVICKYDNNFMIILDVNTNMFGMLAFRAHSWRNYFQGVRISMGSNSNWGAQEIILKGVAFRILRGCRNYFHKVRTLGLRVLKPLMPLWELCSHIVYVSAKSFISRTCVRLVTGDTRTWRITGDRRPWLPQIVNPLNVFSSAFSDNNPN